MYYNTQKKMKREFFDLFIVETFILFSDKGKYIIPITPHLNNYSHYSNINYLHDMRIKIDLGKQDIMVIR
jgi:hypothetical protein